MFRIEISGGPNSSPAKSLFSTVPFRAQIAQIPNSPPTLESPLVSSLSPPFPTSVPDDDDEDDGRASPPHRSYLIYTLVHRTGWSTDNVSCRKRRASQTPSSTASGALHRRRLPAHRGYFTEHIVAPPQGRWGFTNGLVHRIIALRCHSRSASVRGQPTPAHHPQRL